MTLKLTEEEISQIILDETKRILLEQEAADLLDTFKEKINEVYSKHLSLRRNLGAKMKESTLLKGIYDYNAQADKFLEETKPNKIIEGFPSRFPSRESMIQGVDFITFNNLLKTDTSLPMRPNSPFPSSTSVFERTFYYIGIKLWQAGWITAAQWKQLEKPEDRNESYLFKYLDSLKELLDWTDENREAIKALKPEEPEVVEEPEAVAAPTQEPASTPFVAKTIGEDDYQNLPQTIRAGTRVWTHSARGIYKSGGEQAELVIEQNSKSLKKLIKESYLAILDNTGQRTNRKIELDSDIAK